MGIPCSEMLRLPGAERLELVGGGAGLDGEIMWVHLGAAMAAPPVCAAATVRRGRR